MMQQDMVKALDELKKYCEEQIHARVKEEMNYYRQRVWTDFDTQLTCCKDMARLLTDLRDNAGPIQAEWRQGRFSISWRGFMVNYCPFCGVEAK